eukprot:1339183-Amorphochlora_amoeboformis.AAC.1
MYTHTYIHTCLHKNIHIHTQTNPPYPSDFAGCSTVGKSIKRAELLLARQAIATVKGTMELDEVSKANLEACETIAE